ncbi:hypothetical protein [Hoeflea sp. TYP-13]|uniref:hypothetical protein n=1 Tax=Hoeflea sp. TYP-13 TaxID=3230023 RepID=UPI0034C691FE
MPSVKTPETPPVPNPITRDKDAGLRQEARLRRRRSRGSRANVFSSVLGDSGFGSSVVKGATKLGG